LLHPEWPTHKASTGLVTYGRYRRDPATRRYQPVTDGAAGFVDLALGEYGRPRVGIEFGLAYGWTHEHLVFDLLKLMDARNPFTSVFSLNLILRDVALARKGRLDRLQRRMDEAYAEAAQRLASFGSLCDARRGVCCIITELDATGLRRHWHLQRSQARFVPGLPACARERGHATPEELLSP
jgi:hypothetical protein